MVRKKQTSLNQNQGSLTYVFYLGIFVHRNKFL